MGSEKLMHVRLRGADGVPLAHPADGYSPLADVSAEDFCPFSEAVSLASVERVAVSLTEEQLASFCVPDEHIVELYDVADVATLKASIARQLRLPRSGQDLYHVRATSSTAPCALACFRRKDHAAQLVASSVGASDCIDLDRTDEIILARPLQQATNASREMLRQWRGEEYRPSADPSAARRLIHGSLQSQMPLAHLVEEKNRRVRVSSSVCVARH